MKIGFVVDDSIHRPAGVQYGVLNLAEEVLELGHEVAILHCTNPSVADSHIDPRFKLIETSKGINIKGLNLNGSVSSFPGFAKPEEIQKILLTENFDYLYLNYPFSPFVSGRILKVIAKLRQNPEFKLKTIGSLVIHVEEKFIPRLANHVLARICKKSLEQIDLFIHNATPTLIYGQKYLKKDSLYLPNGLKDIQLTPKLKGKNRKIQILFLGRLEYRKGVLDFIECLNLLKQDNPTLLENTELTIVGNGPQMEEAVALKNKYRLHINFLGRVSTEDRDKIYMQSDIAIFPAKYGEAMGVVLLEAMNFGCAVLGYANPGYADTMAEYADRCLVPVDEVNALKVKLVELLAHPEKLADTQKELKQYFQKKFSRKSVGEKFIALLNEIPKN